MPILRRLVKRASGREQRQDIYRHPPLTHDELKKMADAMVGTLIEETKAALASGTDIHARYGGDGWDYTLYLGSGIIDMETLGEQGWDEKSVKWYDEYLTNAMNARGPAAGLPGHFTIGADWTVMEASMEYMFKHGQHDTAVVAAGLSRVAAPSLGQSTGLGQRWNDAKARMRSRWEGR